ncbi:MAG: hypothetical protein ACPG7W_01770 [Paracoccaceae bacterium]
MKFIMALGMAALVAGCGVDGAPLKPELSTSIKLGRDGLSSESRASVRKGPVTVSVDL